MSALALPRAGLSAKTMEVSGFPPDTTALCEPGCHHRQGTFDHLHRVVRSAGKSVSSSIAAESQADSGSGDDLGK